ncbi:polysaccharide deacetylase family protein [Actinomadura kijaniata]|uniref:polysaccharide deacetylase family protein n=1 Tax=Actinomadura kijaniata TaxID=46161 RepID=UPI003F1C68E3
MLGRAWALRGTAVLASAALLAGCGGAAGQRVRPVADSTAVHVVDPGTVPGLSVATRSEQDGRRHLYAAWPRIPGAERLTAALAAAADERIRPFLADTEDRTPGAVPELNVQWSLAAASGDVVGVRLVFAESAGASAGEARRTLWFDGRTGEVRPSADLLRAGDGLAGLAERVRARLGGKGDPARVTARADTFTSLAFNDVGDMVVEFSDNTVAPGSSGRIAVVLEHGDYAPLLSEFGRRAYTAATTPRPRLALHGPATPSPANSPGDTSGTAPGTTPNATVPPGRTDCSTARCIALTFDDGPGPATGRLLDTLRDARARATFFVVGTNADAHADLLRREHAEGHEIGNHTQSHRDLSRLTAVQVNSDVQRTQEIVRSATGAAPTLMRPPYGATNGTVAGVTRSLGLRQVLWSVDTNDWRDRDARIVADRAVRRARPGAVILMHDIHRTTVDAVPEILERLAAKGYTFVTVSELMANRKVPPGGRFGGN